MNGGHARSAETREPGDSRGTLGGALREAARVGVPDCFPRRGQLLIERVDGLRLGGVDGLVPALGERVTGLLILKRLTGDTGPH